MIANGNERGRSHFRVTIQRSPCVSTLSGEQASQEMTQLSLRRARTEAERLLRDTNARHDVCDQRTPTN